MNKIMLRRCFEKKESNFFCLVKFFSGEMYLKKILLFIGLFLSVVDDKKIFFDVMKYFLFIRMLIEC